MQKPFFSVVIPTLNEEKFLPFLLADLSAQTFRAFDVWIVDGHSQDRTLKIAATYAKKHTNVHLVKSDERHVSHQRNAGARASSAEQLVFFDADSRIPAYFLEGIHYQLMKDAFDVWSAWATSDTDQSRYHLSMYLLNVIFEIGAKAKLPFAFGPCMGCTRAAFEALAGFDTQITLAEDIDFVRRAVEKKFTFTMLKDPTFAFCLRRTRKEGVVRLMSKLSPMIVKILQNERIIDPVEAYPMLGGAYFSKVNLHKGAFTPSKAYKTFVRMLKQRKTRISAMIKNIFEE